MAPFRRKLVAALAGADTIPDPAFANGPADTTHISVVDDSGLIAAVTTSAGENAGFVVEETGVLDSYRRSVQVIRENGTEFIALFLLRVGVGILIFVLLFLPGMLMALCCLLWPLLLLVQGFIAAYFSTMWTLAWREWTGLPPASDSDVETLPDAPNTTIDG